MQISSAFGQVQSALSFFVTAYTSIADWKAVLNRLAGFDASIGWAEGLDGTAPRVEVVADGARNFSADDLSESASGCPTARRSCRSRNCRSSPASACWSPGRQARARPACSGRSAGSGRSAKARSACPKRRKCAGAAAAALYAARHLARRACLSRARRMPSRLEEIDDVLDAVGLGASARGTWTRPPIGADKLSGGEQQRLSIARALLQKPALAVPRRGDQRARRRLGGGALSPLARSGCPARPSSRSVHRSSPASGCW